MVYFVNSLSLQGQYPASACRAGLFHWRATACHCCNIWKILRPISPPLPHAVAKRRRLAALIQSCVGPMVLPVNQIAATASLLLGWTNGLAEWILWSICNSCGQPHFLRDRDFARGFRSRCFHVVSDEFDQFHLSHCYVVLCAGRLPLQWSTAWHWA